MDGVLAPGCTSAPGSNVNCVPKVTAEAVNSGASGIPAAGCPVKPSTVKKEPVTDCMTPVVLKISALAQFIINTICPTTGAVIPGKAVSMSHPYVATPAEDMAVEVIFNVILFKESTMVQLEFHPVGKTPVIVVVSPELILGTAVAVTIVASVCWNDPVFPGPFGPDP